MFISCFTDLFDNPVAQEPEYRLYVIHHVPTVELLDRQGIINIKFIEIMKKVQCLKICNILIICNLYPF